MEQKRSEYLDSIRGIAIVLVVVGHAVQVSLPSTFDDNVIFKLIYSFHMPLFMFISGMVTFKEEREITLKWLYKRFKVLIIPFLIWLFIPLFFTKNWTNISSDLLAVIRYPDKHYWFLWVLFLNDAMLWLVDFLSRKLKAHNILGGVLISLVLVFLVKVAARRTVQFGIGLLEWHSVFFFTGYWCGSFRKKIRNNQFLKKYVYMILCLLSGIWVMLVPFWNRVKPPFFMMYFSGLSHFVIYSSYMYIVAFGGIALIFLCVALAKPYRQLPLQKLGTYTAEIYILQNFFFNIIVINNEFLNILCNIGLGLMMPIAVTYLFQTGKIRGLLFGKQ